MKELVLCLLLVAGLCTNVQAQTPVREMSVDDLAKALTPQQATTRSFRNLKVAPAAVDLVINFEFNSARILDSSTPQLQSLAVAMKLQQLQPLRFQVEGHTDAKGGAQYNQLLSEKRAQGVVGFLIKQGIASGRLIAVGKGFDELLNKDDPNAAENRRVRISTLEQ